MALTLGLLAATLDYSAYAATTLPKGPLIFVGNVLDNSVTIVEPSTNKTRRIAVGALPHNWSLSPDGREALVINTGSESVSFFDTRTGNFKRTMLIAPIPQIPPHIKLGPAAFVGKNGCHECHGPHAMGRLPSQATYTLDGKSLWTIPFNPPGMVRVDRATGKHLQSIEFKNHPFKTQPSNLFYTPDGKMLIVLHRRSGGMKVPKPGENGSYAAPTSMGAFDHAAPPGNKASLITFHTPDFKRELGRLVVPLSLPYKADFSKDGKKLYVAYRSTNKVAEIDVPSRKLGRLLVVGEGPINAIVDKMTGKYLYAPSFYDSPGEIAKLELKTGLVRALLPAKISPATIGQDRDTGLIYAVINAANRLQEIDPAGKGRVTREWPIEAFPLDVLVVSESERRR